MDISIFEIIGPIMIGPSSSHTAGMARIGRMAHHIIADTPLKIRLTLHKAIRETYKGHRTDAALVGGLLGISEDSPEMRRALEIAEERGIEVEVGFWPDEVKNPNTVMLSVETENGPREITGISVGGGSFIVTNIDGAPVEIGGAAHHILVWGQGKDLEKRVKEILNVENGDIPRGISAGFGRTQRDCLFWGSFAEPVPETLLEHLKQLPAVNRIQTVPPILAYGMAQGREPVFKTIEDLLNLTESGDKSLFDVIIEYEVKRSGRLPEQIIAQMLEHLKVMRKAVNIGLSENNKLLGGITSGMDGKLLAKAVKESATVGGRIIPMAMARALAVMEVNGSMGQVVAAPTAGSCGIVPGCLLTVQEDKGVSDDNVIRGLIVAAGIGVTMAHAGVSFSGVVGGCQGEVGVSSALAAAGLVELAGGSPSQVVNAMALAIKNILGLICDPIAGPVEVPCIKRNAMGVANAFAAADMALAGITSAIPPDEVFTALKNTQEYLPCELKGTTTGGLACTPTAIRIRNELRNKRND